MAVITIPKPDGAIEIPTPVFKKTWENFFTRNGIFAQYQRQLGDGKSGVMACCGATEMPYNRTLYGFAIGTDPAEFTRMSPYLSKAQVESTDIKGNYGSFTIPETGETIHYYYTQENCVGGETLPNLGSSFAGSEDDEDDEDDF